MEGQRKAKMVMIKVGQELNENIGVRREGQEKMIKSKGKRRWARGDGQGKSKKGRARGRSGLFSVLKAEN